MARKVTVGGVLDVFFLGLAVLALLAFAIALGTWTWQSDLNIAIKIAVSIVLFFVGLMPLGAAVDIATGGGDSSGPGPD
ncbi:hypothetical protein GCM10009682_47620 [Luedemannella flava]|uniref:Uncharacterized protein n=1 Tax=Luedemannella flava TaxID=349316 RepID=A0ABP4YKP9_9ACTN